MEAVNLISSPKYSEKQIVCLSYLRKIISFHTEILRHIMLFVQGYLALTLLMHENSDLVRLVINSIRKDLDEHNETNNCLALHAIANIGGKEMSESLLNDVYSLLISPISKAFVKKKAGLTLLRLYRKHPEIFPITDWALRIVSLMDDGDMVCVFVFLYMYSSHLTPCQFPGCFYSCHQSGPDPRSIPSQRVFFM